MIGRAIRTDRPKALNELAATAIIEEWNNIPQENKSYQVNTMVFKCFTTKQGIFHWIPIMLTFYNNTVFKLLHIFINKNFGTIFSFDIITMERHCEFKIYHEFKIRKLYIFCGRHF